MSEGKKMKIGKISALFLCIAISAAAMTGCGSSGENLAGTVGNLKQNGSAVTSYQGFLGYGYNLVDSGYFSSDYITDNAAVLDTDKLAANRCIYSTPIQDTHIQDSYSAGTDTTSYVKDISAGFTVKGTFFNGSVSNSFKYDSEQQYSSTDSFVTIKLTEAVKDEYINLSDLESLKNYMTEQFKTDIDSTTVTPEQILQKYGTHVILNTVLGGRIEINFKYDNCSQVSKTTLEDEAKAAYNDIKTSASGSWSEETQKLKINSDLNVNLTGGAKDVDFNTLENVRSSYSKWFKNIGKGESLAFIDVNKATVSNPSSSSGDPEYDNIYKYSLWPIWEFAENSTRQAAIKTAYETMLKNSGSAIAKIQPAEYVKDIYFGYGSSNDKAQSNLKNNMQNADSNANRVILDYDLNNHAGGNFIYMGYILTTDSSQAITDLKLDYRKNADKNELLDTVNIHKTVDKQDKTIPYNKYDLDLTKGTGGKYYIAAYYTHDTAAGNPLKAAGIEYGDNNDTFAEDGNLKGWTSVATFNSTAKLDVNKGAGGKDIFIWQKR